MRILLACDKFKGSLSAKEVAESIRSALGRILPEAKFDVCPIADGGEGTTVAIVESLGAEWREAKTVDAQGRRLLVRYGWIPDQQKAVMEMSFASGLDKVLDLKPEPRTASTEGTGMLMADAAAKGAKAILIGIGGSATNDGGLGMAIALGYRFHRAGRPITPTLENILEVDRITRPTTRWDIPVLVACDVDNPLLGPRGATRTYGPQKGVEDFAWFEERLAHLAGLVSRDLGTDAGDIPGAGAAGGLGFGLMAFAGGKLTGGFDLVASQIGLAGRIRQADIVVTGEGRMDEQSLMGKGPVGVARLARRLGSKVVAVAGSITESPALRREFDLMIPVKPPEMSLSEAMNRTPELIAAALDRHQHELRRLA